MCVYNIYIYIYILYVCMCVCHIQNLQLPVLKPSSLHFFGVLSRNKSREGGSISALGQCHLPTGRKMRSAPSIFALEYIYIYIYYICLFIYPFIFIVMYIYIYNYIIYIHIDCSYPPVSWHRSGLNPPAIAYSQGTTSPQLVSTPLNPIWLDSPIQSSYSIFMYIPVIWVELWSPTGFLGRTTTKSATPWGTLGGQVTAKAASTGPSLMSTVPRNGSVDVSTSNFQAKLRSWGQQEPRHGEDLFFSL